MSGCRQRAMWNVAAWATELVSAAVGVAMLAAAEREEAPSPARASPLDEDCARFGVGPMFRQAHRSLNDILILGHCVNVGDVRQHFSAPRPVGRTGLDRASQRARSASCVAPMSRLSSRRHNARRRPALPNIGTRSHAEAMSGHLTAPIGRKSRLSRGTTPRDAGLDAAARGIGTTHGAFARSRVQRRRLGGGRRLGRAASQIGQCAGIAPRVRIWARALRRPSALKRTA